MTVYPARDFTAAPGSIKLAGAMNDKVQTGLLNRHGEGLVALSLPEGSASTKSAVVPIGPGHHGPGRIFLAGPARFFEGQAKPAPPWRAWRGRRFRVGAR